MFHLSSFVLTWCYIQYWRVGGTIHWGVSRWYYILVCLRYDTLRSHNRRNHKLRDVFFTNSSVLVRFSNYVLGYWRPYPKITLFQNFKRLALHQNNTDKKITLFSLFLWPNTTPKFWTANFEKVGADGAP